ncbi:STAS domain-containing protein [Streptomyces sp. NPDC050658]|uniref:STAS domain-containing protein n=1 Tax=unclassified Streptomyces TaxID=2593676 RepID=UPI0034165B7B
MHRTSLMITGPPGPPGPPDSRLTITAHATSDSTALTLTLAGELDQHTAEQLCNTAIDHIKSGHLHLRLDASRVTWCDNASLFVILGLRYALHTAYGHVELASASEPVEQAITRNHLEHILHT